MVATFVRGDADGDGAVELSDGMAVLNFLFQKRGHGPRCLDAADADDDGSTEVNDAIRILNFKFLGGPRSLGYLRNSCAPDPGAGLGCQGYDSCPASRLSDTNVDELSDRVLSNRETVADPATRKVKDSVAKPAAQKVRQPIAKLAR